MTLNESTLEKIRKSDLEINCHQIVIKQGECAKEIFKGYGKIKQNRVGTYLVEFICLENDHSIISNRLDAWDTTLPKNRLNKEEVLHAEFVCLNGDVFKSSGFSITLGLLEYGTPCLFNFLIGELIFEKPILYKTELSSLYFEFLGAIGLPANTKNEFSSSKGNGGFSWDQINLTHKDINFSIIMEKNYTTVKVDGKFNVDKMLSIMIFYLGFSSGLMPQPYLTVSSTNKRTITRLLSINNRTINNLSSNPVPGLVMIKNKSSGDHCYDLLRKIIELENENFSAFASIQGQWEMVWHGINALNNISQLVLSVAIEGLLNDVYIPNFKKHKINHKLEEDIELVKMKLNELEIDKVHKERILSSVSYWKVKTAAVTLQTLVDEGLISINDKKVWTKMRSDAAHPKISNKDELEKTKRDEKILICLDLFHALILNIIGYSGPMNYFGKKPKPITCIIEHIQILKY